MPSSFPGALDNIPNNKTNGMVMLSDHPNHHNLLADAVNAVQLSVRGGPPLNVRDYGAVGDGVTDDRGAIVAAETALGAGGTLLFPAGTYRLATSLALAPTTNLLSYGGAVLAPAAGTTVRIAGTVLAGLYPVFAVGAGTVVFDRVQTLYPEWWGATTYVKTRQAGGAIGSGSATFTTGGDPAFTSADVGKIAVVLGAGAAGAPLVTTIAAVVSGAQATLAATAGTTVSSARWAVGLNQTASVQACLDASSAGAKLCPVALTDLYGIGSLRLRNNQVLSGLASIELCGFVRLASDANPAVSLAAGVSGDTMRLENFVVNAMFFGALDGVELGTASPSLALANALMANILVRNAGGWAFNLRANGLVSSHLVSKHDQAPPASNTTAGGFRFIDSLVYATATACTGYYPAGTHWLGAGGGSVYVGVEAEASGAYPTMDMVTIAAHNVRVSGLYLTNTGSCRDLVRVPTGFVNAQVDAIFLGGAIACTTILNDLDRGYTFPGPTSSDVSIPVYRTFLRWLQADVAATQTTSSTSYTDLATPGPSVTFAPGLTTDQFVTVIADVANSGANVSLLAPSLAGTAAQDTNAATNQGTSFVTVSKRTGAGNQVHGATHTVKYRAAAGTASFAGRRIIVEVVEP